MEGIGACRGGLIGLEKEEGERGAEDEGGEIIESEYAGGLTAGVFGAAEIGLGGGLKPSLLPEWSPLDPLEPAEEWL
jgi:hypothetical protein